MPEFKEYRRFPAYFDRFDIVSAYALFTVDWQIDLCYYNTGLREQLVDGGANLLPIRQQEKINSYYSRVTGGRCKADFKGNLSWKFLEENAKFIYANLCIKHGFEFPVDYELPSDED